MAPSAPVGPIMVHPCLDSGGFPMIGFAKFRPEDGFFFQTKATLHRALRGKRTCTKRTQDSDGSGHHQRLESPR
jgi:hypothetical protein